MKIGNRIVYTFKELKEMGINSHTLRMYMYGKNSEKYGVEKVVMPVPTIVTVVSKEDFTKHFLRLIKKTGKSL